MRTPHFAIRLDDEDRALLEAVAKLEKLPQSEIFRRGLRLYAKQLGVKQPKAKRTKDTA